MGVWLRNILEDVDKVLSMNYNIGINFKDFKKEGLLKYVNSIEIKETVEGADTATVLISDPEFKFISDDLFVDKAGMWVTMHWKNSTDLIEFHGFISAIDVNFQDNGIPQLTITGMDRTSYMNREKHNRTFCNCTSAEVVACIVPEYGLIPVIDPNYAFPVKETITQSNQTDIDFITKLASDEVYPFTARIIGNEFHYERMGKLESPKLNLTYGAFPYDLISFAPQINKETKQEEITKSSIDTGSKEVSNTTGTVTSNNTSSTNSSNSVNSGSSSKTSTNYVTYDPTKKGQEDRWRFWKS